MEIGEVFHPEIRSQWRDWLASNHVDKTEIWLRRFKKASGKPTLTYDEIVEECLCFGWIDGVIKKYDEESNVQRISRRRQKTFLSELNRQRVWKLQAAGMMTPAGVKPIADQIGSPDDPWKIPEALEARLREDGDAWANFVGFSKFYQRLKIGWITESGSSRPDEMERRMRYLIKCTKIGKMYGTVPIDSE